MDQKHSIFFLVSRALIYFIKSYGKYNLLIKKLTSIKTPNCHQKKLTFYLLVTEDTPIKF
ncbi:hypothetical protein ATO12_23320 [Aquimarina atlantica]|uniref:Uncharacterized protein n=1 Tax=Aquimarina atlantica TaxID=1317122 RepID=A0A023BQN9_9FLAO|nr:hypothetical protein ATO12_23320 [Aquimarina atlantica]